MSLSLVLKNKVTLITLDHSKTSTTFSFCSQLSNKYKHVDKNRDTWPESDEWILFFLHQLRKQFKDDKK